MSAFVNVPCIKITQPIGSFFIGSIKAKDLCEITKYDFRHLSNDEGFESYIGINRKVDPTREADIAKYVGTSDACFPTSIILAMPAVCVEYDEQDKHLKIQPYVNDEGVEEISFDKIATVLDGQHRIAGLKKGTYPGDFEINISIFIDLDIADQAYVFSTINLAQTKVNKSLVYDLFDFAKARSPQKICHNIAVALDKEEDSPFHKKIKRLGTSTEGRFNETITQATFIDSLIVYITNDRLQDREIYRKKSKPNLIDADELKTLFLRNMFIEEKDLEITDIVWNYFDAVKMRWPKAWLNPGRGEMLNKTNGFRALMRFLRPCYLHITLPGNVPTKEEYYKVFEKIDFNDEHFTIDEYRPGTSGESRLYHDLKDKANIP
jgi:DGQHR domain-containing protein